MLKQAPKQGSVQGDYAGDPKSGHRRVAAARQSLLRSKGDIEKSSHRNMLLEAEAKYEAPSGRPAPNLAQLALAQDTAAPSHLKELSEKLVSASHRSKVFQQFIEHTLYFSEIKKRSGFGLLKHWEFPSLAIISYITAFLMLTIDFELTKKAGKFAESFFNFIAILLVALVGRLSYSTLSTVLLTKAQRSAYTHQHCLHLLAPDHKAYQRYQSELRELNFYYCEILRMVGDDVEDVSPITKARAQLNYLVLDQTDNYQAWIMTLFCYLTQKFIKEATTLNRLDAIKHNLITSLVLGVVLMIILDDPHWLRNSILWLAQKINHFVACLLDCLSGSLCCRKHKAHWTERDKAGELSLSRAGEITPRVTKEMTLEEQEKAFAELIARKERGEKVTESSDHSPSNFFTSGPYTLVTENGKIIRLLEDIKSDHAFPQVRALV